MFVARPHSLWSKRVTLSATLATLALGAACDKASTSPSSSKRVYGAAQSLGQGTARSYVTLDRAGKPTSLGVALSEAAMSGLPQTPMAGMPSAAMLILSLPAASVATGFDHVMLDWNPAGHEPDHVYTHPHFDFHFYQITSAQREAIIPSDPQWAAKVGRFPSAEYVPNGYAAASVLGGVPAATAGVPYMGMHWLDVASPELQPPPAGKQFTSTFIYGTWDGAFIFAEPMITKAFLESTKAMPNGVNFPVGVAQKVAKAGAYPTSYSIIFDSQAREYRISLDGLVQR